MGKRLESELGTEIGLETEAELEFHVNPVNAYNATEIIEADKRNRKAEYFHDINFEIISYNVSLGTIGISCRKQDEAKLKQILTEYISRRFTK